VVVAWLVTKKEILLETAWACAAPPKVQAASPDSRVNVKTFMISSPRVFAREQRIHDLFRKAKE
jgi:hypothetical protein